MVETYDIPTWDPFYLICSQCRCPDCGNPADVVALVAERYDEYLEDPEVTESQLDPLGWLGVAVLSPVVRIPPDLLCAIQSIAPCYQWQRSPTGAEHFMNHCRCGASLPDQMLYVQGGPFDVHTAEGIATRAISLTVLPCRGLRRIVCDLLACDGIEFIHHRWWRDTVAELHARLLASRKPGAHAYGVAVARALACLRQAEKDLESWKLGIDPHLLPPESGETKPQAGAGRDSLVTAGPHPDFQAWDPFYVIRSTYKCWRCGHISAVASLVVERWVDLSEERPCALRDSPPDYTQWVVLLGNIELLSEELEDAVRQYAPDFRRDFSRTIKTSYFMNHCGACDARFGDFFLGDVGGPFWATTPEEMEAKGIEITPLPPMGIQLLRANAAAGGTIDRSHEHWWKEKVWRLSTTLQVREDPGLRACGVALERAMGELSYIERRIQDFWDRARTAEHPGGASLA